MPILIAQIFDPIFNQLLQPALDKAGENAWILYIAMSVVFYFLSSRRATSKAQEIIQDEFKKTSEERDNLRKDVKTLQNRLFELEKIQEQEAEEKRKISTERDKLAEELSQAQVKIRVLEVRLHDMEVSMETQRDLLKDLIDPLVAKLQSVLKSEEVSK